MGAPEKYTTHAGSPPPEHDNEQERVPEISFTGHLVARPVISRKTGSPVATMGVIETRRDEQGRPLPPVEHVVTASGGLGLAVERLAKQYSYVCKLRTGTLVSIVGSREQQPNRPPVIIATSFKLVHMSSGGV